MTDSIDGMPIIKRTCRVKESSTVRVERKIIEKNRRNQMKILYSQLYSLLPNHASKEQLPLPEKIDEVVQYIKSLEAKLKLLEERKERLKSRKRSSSSMNSVNEKGGSMFVRSPEIQINEMGSRIQVALLTGPDDQFVFYEVIRILEEDNVHILSLTSSTTGDSMTHVVLGELGKYRFFAEGAKVSERLKSFVYGSPHSDTEWDLQLWNFGIDTNAWLF